MASNLLAMAFNLLISDGLQPNSNGLQPKCTNELRGRSKHSYFISPLSAEAPFDERSCVAAIFMASGVALQRVGCLEVDEITRNVTLLTTLSTSIVQSVFQDSARESVDVGTYSS